VTSITVRFIDCGVNGKDRNLTYLLTYLLVSVNDKILIENLRKEKRLGSKKLLFMSRSTYKMPVFLLTH